MTAVIKSVGRAIALRYLDPGTPLLPDPSQEIDILLPLGPGSPLDNIELRFALRSIERFARGYRRVVVVGLDPGFLDLTNPRLAFVPCKESSANHEARILHKLAWSFYYAGLTDHAAAWNDDYVLLRETDVRTIPFYYGEKLEWTVRRRRGDGYGEAAARTAETLKLIQRSQFNYDIHCPIIYERSRFLGLEPWWEMCRREPNGLLVKSCYANVNCVQGVQMDDLKLNRFEGPEYLIKKTAGRWIYSYGDLALQKGLRKELDRMFPEPSMFEK